MTLTRRADGTTVLDGPVPDQSALHGLLGKVNDLGLPLVSVTPPLGSGPRPRPTCRTRSTTADEDDLKEHPMTTDPPAVHTATTTRQASARRRMEPTRKIALAAGIAYLVTFAASIPQLK